MFEKEILDIIRNDDIYDYIAQNYYKLTNEQMKNLLLEALYAISETIPYNDYQHFLEEYADNIEANCVIED